VDYEVIVANDGSSDGTLAILRQYPCQIIHLEKNKGRSFARNRAIEASRSDLLLFTDADCIVEPDWVRSAWTEFRRLKERDPQLAGVQGRVRPLKSFIDKCEAYANYGYLQNKTAGPTDNFCTANIIAEKRALQEAGLFKEGLHYYEDRDLGIRVHARGYRIAYAPRLAIVHDHVRKSWRAFLNYAYQSGKHTGFYFETQYPDFHATPLSPWMTQRFVYLFTLPLFAALITLRIVARNFFYDPAILLLAPFIFASKIAYRMGVCHPAFARGQAQR